MFFQTDPSMQIEIIHNVIGNQQNDDAMEEEFQFAEDTGNYRASKSEITSVPWNNEPAPFGFK